MLGQRHKLNRRFTDTRRINFLILIYILSRKRNKRGCDETVRLPLSVEENFGNSIFIYESRNFKVWPSRLITT
jgi:hypothetical protein